MARAMWKGVVRIGDARVPVKLHSAVEDRAVHFRLLHRADGAPVEQRMIEPGSGDVVPYETTRRAFVTRDGDVIVLEPEELEEIEPEASRDIDVLQLVPSAAIDHRWFLRPYFLGPDDGASGAYAALARFLETDGRVGVARWVMRKKAYVGALLLREGRPMLVTLRRAEDVVAADELPRPEGPEVKDKELAMARQLIEMLHGEPDLDDFEDDYRARVEELLETKARGGEVRREPLAAPEPTDDLLSALEESLKRGRRSA